MSNATTYFLGRTAEGYAVYARLRGGMTEAGHTVTFTDHTTTTEPVESVAITWTVADVRATAANYAADNGAAMSSPYFDRHIIGGGQVAPEHRVIVAPVMDADTVAFIERMWSEWHLNTMTAACDHMRPGVDYVEPDAAALPVKYGRPDVRGWRLDNVECAAGTGYRYGHAWLARRVPAADWDRFAALARG